MTRMRLRFWLAMLDASNYLRMPRSVYYWILLLASNCISYAPIERDDGKEPF